MPNLFIIVAAIVAGLAGGFFIGRRMSVDTLRARALDAELEDARKDQEIALAELDAAKHEWVRVQSELERYRHEVVDHFTGTSDMLRDLTLQYRNVYDHIADGAKLLCPEGSVRIDAGVEIPVLSSQVSSQVSSQNSSDITSDSEPLQES